jgi:hypothetical protein
VLKLLEVPGARGKQVTASSALVNKLWNYCNNLPAPAILAAEIVEDLQAALAQFAHIAADLAKTDSPAATEIAV